MGRVAVEQRRGVDLDQAVVIHAERTRRTRALALRLHFTFEAGFVQGQVTLAGDVTGEVHREAVGVVQLEHHVTRDDITLEACQIGFKNFQALLQGLGKLLFFSLEHALDVRLLRRQLREGVAHLGHQCRDDLIEEAAVGTQLVTVTAGAADDATQHIAAALVGRQHAVGDQKAARTDMVGHHFERGLAFVAAADGLGGGGEQAFEQIDLVVGIDVLQHRAHAFKAHAGVDRRGRQRMQDAVGGAVELHEDVVPDLDVTVAIFFRRARWAAPDVGAVVKEYLGARATRAGITHGPEIVGSVRGAFVVANTHHALGRYADFLGPDVVGFVIRGIDRDPEFVLGQLEHAGEKGPGEGNGISLEVVAKAEVTQHFEKCMVARCVTDVFQVVVLAASAYAFLAGHGTGIGALFLTQEAILELVHACVGEQQGRVVARNQGAGGDSGMALFFEETKEGFTDFCAFH